MKKLFTLGFVAFALSLAICSAAFASEKVFEKVEAKSECTDTTKYVEALNQSVADIVANVGNDDAKKTELLTEVFKKNVNIGWIARFVLGKNWRGLSKQQQDDYLSGYENYILQSYVPVFKEYKGEKVEVLQTKKLNDRGEFLITTKVNRIEEPEVQVAYRVRKDADCFRVYDIVAEGVSLLNTQRQDFSSVVNRSGFDELVKMLKNKKAAEPK